MKRSAFTLIELLVVIAIIALLAAIAIPVFGTAMEKARGAQCLANLNQIGKAFVLYLNDNDDDFFGRSSEKTWPQKLHDKYSVPWKQLRSPFDKETGDRPSTETGNNIPVSYGVNKECFDTNTGKWTAASELIIAAPAMEQSPEVKFSGIASQNVDLSRPSGGGRKYGTHSNRNRINALFGDGHVEGLLWKDYSANSGDEGRRRWEPVFEKQ
jgi:prepilin-type N-terminal cleavage/methylation domain-containing protein/prepilin-type processing-associated H-X9-DG protein